MIRIILSLVVILTFTSCKQTLVADIDQSEADRLIQTIKANIGQRDDLKLLIDIDHSRLAIAAGEPISASHVVIFANDQLTADMVANNPLIALNVPLKVLAYEDENGGVKVIWNDIEYIENRFDVQFSAETREQYANLYNAATANIDSSNIANFASNIIDEESIVTLVSELSFNDTVEKAIDVISSNDDVTIFQDIDLQAQAAEVGTNINALQLIMYGAPAPGGKAMRNAKTLGVDAFPQKLIVWEDDQGGVFVSYNNLSAIVERQQVDSSFGLFMIEKRIDFSLRNEFNK